ncbi:adenylate/guanylate cyclase domain-containing protein [Turneriella parva]|uniref:Adenylate cyclase n=1 Tax=Turneriella parva (strain ATCC BAA-1111 / DSM 21527 / NCTC 11395 / H) TaxID=869212 RepID=I4B4X2_TURPD|nr:adenylate/guanylate cyclase domain-containing protein [Turneriella parva]AFM12329.1 adenylate/guanylate cyclase [Turneriella parva DSM 21527]
MQRWFEKMSNAGVTPETPWREAKGIRLRNRLAFVVGGLLIGNMPLQILFWHEAELIFYLLIGQMFIQFSTIPLNSKRQYVFSYLVFLLTPITGVAVYTVLGGSASNIPLFMLTVIMAAYFSGGNEMPRLRNIVVLLAFVTFLFLEFMSFYMEPIISFSPMYIKWLRHTIDFGMVTFAFGLTFYIAREIRKSDDEIEAERTKSEKLLLNVLPAAIAAQLKHSERVIAERYEESSVLFADIAGFTVLSSKLPPDEVVQMLDEVFREFDALAGKFGLEKIKTIGDAYMVAAGLPERRHDHCEAIFDLAIAMQKLMQQKFSKKFDGLELRIGIHSGPVVAGVIGTVKFAYDLWGDTVNTASRMESHGVTGQIHVTETVYQRLKNRHRFKERGELDIKGKGLMKTYLFEAVA